MIVTEQIPLFKVYMSVDAVQAVSKVLQSGYIGQGPIVEEFEDKLKSFFVNNNVVTTNAATSAEHIALHMLKKPEVNLESHHSVIYSEKRWPGISEGDEVLTTPLTCTATNWPIISNNLRLKWVDVDPETCNMDLTDLERKISEKTKAIMVVHWGGYPVDLDRLKLIQKKAFDLYGFKPVIIEDCAHAFGSTYKGAPIGSHGNICTFSFQAIKHLTSGDGGCIVFPHRQQAQRARLLRWFGIDREQNRKDFRCENDVPEVGFKMHMNDINASIGLANLEDVKSIVLPTHIDNANYYSTNLKNISGLQLLQSHDDRQSSYWLYTIKVERQADFMKKMAECNIMVSRVHERNDIHSCVSQFKSILPNLDGLVKEMVCIPVGWWVTKENREYIVSKIKEGW